jgi:hypothetical protein
MRVILLAAAATLGDLAGCAKPQPLDVMMAPAVCDSVPPPVTPGERVGGELPPGIAAPADSGVVLGVVQQARTGRPLQAASVLLRPRDAMLLVGSSCEPCVRARTPCGRLSSGISRRRRLSPCVLARSTQSQLN